MMGWLRNAKEQGELRLTDDLFCPFCFSEKEKVIPSGYVTCIEHQWANKDWFNNWFEREGSYCFSHSTRKPRNDEEG